MAQLVWDKVGERLFETGVSKGVLFVYDKTSKKYGAGVAWNGLTAVNQSPEGADATDLYADNIKYLSLRSAENFKATIEAYTYPEEFAACNGEAELAKGITIGQQDRASFCFCYTTQIGNDTENTNFGYKIHLVYGCTAAPSSKDYSTINDSPDAITLSWEISTVPVEVSGHKPTSHIEIDSTKVDAAKLKKIEDALYGTSTVESKVLMPAEILALLA